jgi:hypothetical protein
MRTITALFTAAACTTAVLLPVSQAQAAPDPSCGASITDYAGVNFEGTDTLDVYNQYEHHTYHRETKVRMEFYKGPETTQNGTWVEVSEDGVWRWWWAKTYDSNGSRGVQVGGTWKLVPTCDGSKKVTGLQGYHSYDTQYNTAVLQQKFTRV